MKQYLKALLVFPFAAALASPGQSLANEQEGKKSCACSGHKDSKKCTCKNECECGKSKTPQTKS